MLTTSVNFTPHPRTQKHIMLMSEDSPLAICFKQQLIKTWNSVLPQGMGNPLFHQYLHN